MAETDKAAILRELMAEAEKRFGRGRLDAIREVLEATAAELAQVRAAAVGPETEPMFYPHPAD
jgi:tetrahydromethanopterin S-methyltransferase subunit G